MLSVAAKKDTQTGKNAWLLDFGKAGHAAVGGLVLLELIEQAKIYPLPFAPDYCCNVLFWKDHLLPVLDMAARLGELPQQPGLLAVVAYRSGEAVSFGALLLSSMPVALTVVNAQACPFPDHPSGWQRLAISCFAHLDMQVPVVNLAKAFAQ
jgi:hypothetical protein